MQLNLTPGLSGKFQSGGGTEIKVEIASPQAGFADLIINDSNGETIYHLQINEHRKTTRWLAVRPHNNGEMTVTLVPERGAAISRSIRFSPIQDPLTLVSIEPKQDVWQPGADKIPGQSTILLISATGFPHTPQGYAPVRSIVTDLLTLTALDAQQSQALGAYLGACGILLLDDASPTILTRLAGKAGCGGRFVKGFRRLDEVLPLLGQLVPQRPAKLPGSTELSKLELSTGHRPVLIYLAVYLLLMALLGRLSRQPALLLIFPLVTAGAGLVAWVGEGQQHLIIWAETTAGDPHARYSALLSTGGDRRGLQETICSQGVTLSRDGHLSTTTPPIEHDEASGNLWIASESALFSPQLLHLTGLLANPQALDLELRMLDDHPSVSNQGHLPSPTGRLIWENRSYPVPALQPEQVWQPASSDDLTNNPVWQLLSRRLAYGEAALLYPLSMDPRLIAPSATRTSAWLVIRLPQEPG